MLAVGDEVVIGGKSWKDTVLEEVKREDLQMCCRLLATSSLCGAPVDGFGDDSFIQAFMESTGRTRTLRPIAQVLLSHPVDTH